MMPRDPHNPMYQQAFFAELMQCIPPAPRNPPKEDKVADRVARRNPKTYGGSNDPMELEEWIKVMEKNFAVIKVAKDNKVTVGTLYLTKEADIWWNTVKDKLTGPKLTQNKFLGKLRVKFYLITVQ